MRFPADALLVGENNAGKSTVCEALELVLGPERLFRRPVVDEHDFFEARYLDDGEQVEIRIQAVLVDLSEEAVRRFGERHLRRWSEDSQDFADLEGGPEAGDADDACWALPIEFRGRYNVAEDDFEGATFFSHPAPEESAADEEQEEGEDEEDEKLGGGLDPFRYDHKRLCGFVYLRTLRTGTRALSLQRGSLLDTILRLGADGMQKMWEETLRTLRDLDPAIGEIQQLARIREEIRARMARFVNLAPSESTAFFASELTRANLREVVRFFAASERSGHLLPFQRLGTGTVNILVFALLTFIAELKGERSVIFAMEEPEIALPPHTQRRVTRFVLQEMGQAIVTSHSPYVIEQFEPASIVMLNRDPGGQLAGVGVDLSAVKEKTFRRERRQFAEAVLARAVLVVEGATEAVMIPAIADVLEQELGPAAYAHPDLAGLSFFNAGTDSQVPPLGPVFKSLGKSAFSLRDKSKGALPAEALAQLGAYDIAVESPHSGAERLLAEEIAPKALRRFLEAAGGWPDYPSLPKYKKEMTDPEVVDLTRDVLEARKGSISGYAGRLIEFCEGVDELPQTVVKLLKDINEFLAPPTPQAEVEGAESE